MQPTVTDSQQEVENRGSIESCGESLKVRTQVIHSGDITATSSWHRVV